MAILRREVLHEKKESNQHAGRPSGCAVMRSGEKGRKIDNFRERVSSMKADGQGRLRSEREKLYNKVRMLENEIATLENNIGFFANSKGAEKLVADVKAKIEKAKADMAEAIEKVKVIDEN